MALYFEVKATYDKMTENGLVKKVTEPYLFDALSFAEAESRAIEELTPFISGEFTVKACKRTPIAEIFNLGAERYYLAKVAFITIDEKKNKEQQSISQILVGASSFQEACTLLEKNLRGTISDYEVKSVTETQLIDVYTNRK